MTDSPELRDARWLCDELADALHEARKLLPIGSMARAENALSLYYKQSRTWGAER